MMDERRFDELLRTSLGRRGAPAPFAVDVADRVMARVRLIGPPPRTEMGVPQLARWAAAAAVAGVALAGALLWQGPSLETVASGFGQALAEGTGALLKLAAPAGALAGTIGRVASAVMSSLETLVRPLAPFQPFARAGLVAVAAAMLGITTVVVGRDVTQRVAPQEHA
jgi:hypothetical protein